MKICNIGVSLGKDSTKTGSELVLEETNCIPASLYKNLLLKSRLLDEVKRILGSSSDTNDNCSKQGQGPR